MRGLSGLIGMTAALGIGSMPESFETARRPGRMRGRRPPGKPGPQLFAGAPVPPAKLTADQRMERDQARNKRKAAMRKRSQ